MGPPLNDLLFITVLAQVQWGEVLIMMALSHPEKILLNLHLKWAKICKTLTEISSQGHYSKSKQASKESFATQSSVVLEFSLRCSRPLQRKPDTRRHY